MTPHVPEDLLVAFAHGDVDEQLAVHIATHLDACPACATQATSLNPLANAFAAMPDPITPTGLVDAILNNAAQPVREPITELVVGGSLMGIATGLMFVVGNPLGSLLHLPVAAKALSGIASPIAVGLMSGNTVLAIVVMTLASTWAAARTTQPIWRVS